MADKKISKLSSLITRSVEWGKQAWEYYNNGVWQDSRHSWKVNLVKVVNLTVRGFTDGDLQSKACAMTYRTLLAIVPMLALLLAIGRGFGLQDYLQQELYAYFPAQRRVLDTSFRFVDSYLEQASEGLFVGIGIAFLLWTLISLLSNVEDVFNSIWGVKNGRTIWRKLSDYTAILLILPVLMICSSGITVLMSSTLKHLFDWNFFTPVLTTLLDSASVVLSWLAFAGAYMLVPNTRVKPLNALAAGVLAGTGYQVLQWLFVSGQMYVAKYNAIYGSFSFLPLLLIWLQLVWLITFIGAGVCYSSQNIFQFAFENQVNRISVNYRLKVQLAILTIIVKRFKNNEAPLTAEAIVRDYAIPPRLVTDLVNQLLEIGLVCHVGPNDAGEEIKEWPLVPTHEPAWYSVGSAMDALLKHGVSDFIPDFSTRFASVDTLVDSIEQSVTRGKSDVELTSLTIG
ncbi:MAG: YihY/virulence factor BrkB family protein [Bacteroides sp.]|nr:YihY/virulence factor BrkB family protein [Bacteroides sp.]